MRPILSMLIILLLGFFIDFVEISFIVVPILASLGMVVPKTSSKAITSAAGTADTMGALARVDLSARHLHEVVEKTGACIAWGGALELEATEAGQLVENIDIAPTLLGQLGGNAGEWPTDGIDLLHVVPMDRVVERRQRRHFRTAVFSAAAVLLVSALVLRLAPERIWLSLPLLMIAALSNFLLGGPEVGQGALSNFYAIHVALLPFLMGAVMMYHFWKVRKNGGISQPVLAPGERRLGRRAVGLGHAGAQLGLPELAAQAAHLEPGRGLPPERHLPRPRRHALHRGGSGLDLPLAGRRRVLGASPPRTR